MPAQSCRGGTPGRLGDGDNKLAVLANGSLIICQDFDSLRHFDPAGNLSWQSRATIPRGREDQLSREGLTTDQASCDRLFGVFDAQKQGCPTTILKNAFEQFDDGIGNENGLCESNETCIYMPNIGVYQGHGALVPAATIGSGGTIQNVTLLKYETNGI